MNAKDFHGKKYKRPKKKIPSTTNPETSKSNADNVSKTSQIVEPLCPLLAKDSEWVDVLHLSEAAPSNITHKEAEEEEVLQLVDCEDGPDMKPLAIMFPGLLDKDPQILDRMLNKTMSTTEVTKHLVDLGQKANFTFMKKANRLIPPDKKWLESVVEHSESHTSLESEVYANIYDAETETSHTTYSRNQKPFAETTIKKTARCPRKRKVETKRLCYRNNFNITY